MKFRIGQANLLCLIQFNKFGIPFSEGVHIYFKNDDQNQSGPSLHLTSLDAAERHFDPNTFGDGTKVLTGIAMLDGELMAYVYHLPSLVRMEKWQRC